MKTRQIALVLGLALAVIFSGIFFVSNNSLKKNLNKEKIKSEELLSQKLNLDKSLDKIKRDLSKMKDLNVDKNKKINDLTQDISKKDAEVKKLIAQNASLKTLEKKVKELEDLKDKLNAELYALKSANDNLKFENMTISEQLAMVSQDKEKLIINNTILKAIAGNNYRIEAVRGKNDKLTVQARKTQKLVVTFDLPTDVGDNISFKLLTPDGKEFESKNNELAAINILENSDNFYASIEEMGEIGTKRIEMTYKPNEKLGKGVYEFEIYNETTYIGSTQLRLR
ncbi:MAG TPA: hypothetical protein DCG75_10480 [Bacteroidales bacterium]|jgi:hypothetical protein|nr:hypothetical protein [Bacteroidales bacterium]